MEDSWNQQLEKRKLRGKNEKRMVPTNGRTDERTREESREYAIGVRWLECNVIECNVIDRVWSGASSQCRGSLAVAPTSTS